ncbi:MAG: hypothetical protein A3C35_01890 [Omnitrophica bacterium RIFCSPHIGHO2_02_FULL_46_11]|nr:MAG: hypothetical protein A3A81_06455 [Omnitrophica bacterium RIFCSPLOWO2_01_FULL_45_10b]OGW85612.1 MAG: hypothetical protein A3C35_01890 [Omnitrophica bacterium RIFCSPHIGHO2_02_FULL_46_11]
MIKKIGLISIFVLMITRCAFAETPEQIAQVWKERGFVALSRVDSLSGKDDAKSKYQYLLEYAFAMHATADKSKEFAFVHKTENDLDFYKIILNKGKNPKPVIGGDEAGLFVINYIYDHKTGEFIGTKIELLPRGWYIHSNPAMPNTLLLDVMTDKIFIVFDLLNPMDSYIENLE